jgi:hypothetical protein
MEVFSALNCDTYKHATLEFLTTFRDDLAILGRNTIVSFSLNNTPHCLTFEEFCSCLGLSTTGELDITDNVVQEAGEAWQHISVHRNQHYLRKKSATIQNPTIRYFATFLANSLFRDERHLQRALPQHGELDEPWCPAHSVLLPPEGGKLR